MIWTNRLRQLQSALAVAAAAALVTAILLELGGRSPWAACLGLLLAGLVLGVIRSAVQNVSELQAATAADRRFRLDDLLATALSLPPAADQRFASAVLAMADARCRRLSAADVCRPIASGRAWAATGLAVALVLAVVQLPQRAVSSEIPRPMAGTGLSSAASPELNRIDATPMRPPGDGSLDEPSNRASDQQDGFADNGQIGNGQATSSPADRFSAGAGIGRSSAAEAPITFPAGDGNSIASAGNATAGGGPSGARGNGHGNSGAGTGTDHTVPSVSPWQSSSWPAAELAAQRAIQSGRIDPAYQPLVRDYFSHP